MEGTNAMSLEVLIEEIIQMYCRIYHKPLDEGRATLVQSNFYQALSASNSEIATDSVEVNFVRFQNEIEYGNWHA